MPFMVPEIFESDFILVDGPAGIDCIPSDVIDWREQLKSGDRPGDAPGAVPVPDALKDYTENREVYSIERRHGWLYRLTAPGYMDCTAWGWADSEVEAVKALAEENDLCPSCLEDECDCTVKGGGRS